MDPLYHYILFCLTMPIAEPICRTFWTWAMHGAAMLAVFSFAAVALNVVIYARKYREALRAQEEREKVADPETMERYRWREDSELI